MVRVNWKLLVVGCVSCLTSIQVANAQFPNQSQHAPWTTPSSHGTIDSAADQAFQLQLGRTVTMPDFVVVDDRAVGESPTMVENRKSPRKLEPTLAKRTATAGRGLTAQSAIVADDLPSRNRMRFGGPPVQPAQPFIGWKFGQSAKTANTSQIKAPKATPTQIALVPQYLAYHAENPSAGRRLDGGNMQSIANAPSPEPGGRSGTFFSLQQNKPASVAKASPKACPNCGRHRNLQTARNSNNNRLR